MATLTKEQLSDIVNRVSAEVTKEVTVGEGQTFQVADLRAQFADLTKGGDSAWTISYSTASGMVSDKLLGRLGDVAWEISYSTSSGSVVLPVKAK